LKYLEFIAFPKTLFTKVKIGKVLVKKRGVNEEGDREMVALLAIMAVAAAMTFDLCFHEK
jgi:hypothetical protein